MKWLLTVRSRNVVVTASIFRSKAKKLAENINIKGFEASDGWLDFFNNRHNIYFQIISGEGNSCVAKMTALWKKKNLPTVWLK